MRAHLQVCVVRAAVPEVRDVAAVHDFSEDVAQVIPWHRLVVIDVVPEDVGADLEVARVERVRPRPALRAEAAAAEHNAVEKAQRKKC